jgi:hypothetical protein
MLNPGMAGFAAAPAFDVGSALGAMNPGMAGFGAGATGGGAFDPMAPLVNNQSWFDRNMPSNQQLGSALGALGKGAGAAGGSKDAGPIMPGAGHQAAVGAPGRGGQTLDALVQMLAKRREALMASATGGVGAGAPQGAQRTIGLLGM